MQITAAAERLGTATSLLSLDRIVPYYTLMGLTPSQESQEAVKLCVREAILENRKDFLANPNRVPDLESHLISTFDLRFGSRATTALFLWYKEDFVHEATDFPPCFIWQLLLNLASRDPTRWLALNLPSSISEKAQKLFNETRDTTDLDKIEEQLEKKRLSEWDTQMYVIHGFNDNDDDAGMSPFMWVSETIEKRRFLNYLRWLRDQLSENERELFFSSGNALRLKLPTTQNMPSFSHPFNNLG